MHRRQFLASSPALGVATSLELGMYRNSVRPPRHAAVVPVPRGAVQSEIDRYCVWPGQASGHKIGHIKPLRLRAAAQSRLGARFYLRGFHEAVLEGGAMPLEVLERVVNDWVKRS